MSEEPFEACWEGDTRKGTGEGTFQQKQSNGKGGPRTKPVVQKAEAERQQNQTV